MAGNCLAGYSELRASSRIRLSDVDGVSRTIISQQGQARSYSSRYCATACCSSATCTFNH